MFITGFVVFNSYNYATAGDAGADQAVTYTVLYSSRGCSYAIQNADLEDRGLVSFYPAINIIRFNIIRIIISSILLSISVSVLHRSQVESCDNMPVCFHFDMGL